MFGEWSSIVVHEVFGEFDEDLLDGGLSDGVLLDLQFMLLRGLESRE